MIIPIWSGDPRTNASGLKGDREPSRPWSGHGTLPGSLYAVTTSHDRPNSNV